MIIDTVVKSLSHITRNITKVLPTRVEDFESNSALPSHGTLSSPLTMKSQYIGFIVDKPKSRFKKTITATVS